MKVLILGGDGYLGWPTAMDFAADGNDVRVVDNYLRRSISKETKSESLFKNPDLEERSKIYKQITEKNIKVYIGDCNNFEFINKIIKEFIPDTIIHYAEQPSAPYSMIGYKEANLTLQNNINSTFNVIWSIIESSPNSHLIKLGTMGEYGTPDIDIEEGWLNVNHNGRTQKFLYPRQSGSLYHTTKILDTDLLWFYVRYYGLKVTDLMQGPVYGIVTTESIKSDYLLPNFHYDDIFGTVINRFLVQAVAGIPLTVYGNGGQTRGYIDLKDTLQCVKIASKNPAKNGEMNIYNQFTEQFTVNELADKISKIGNQKNLKVNIQHITNPRKEMEDHYYNARHDKFIELGLMPNYLTDESISNMLDIICRFKSEIVLDKIMPRVKWNK